eukprot:m.111891 g.111891  ORF g.111891 m.111891 type:complete len:100 (+) comp17016_c3_seq4:630-929(+)
MDDVTAEARYLVTLASQLLLSRLPGNLFSQKRYCIIVCFRRHVLLRYTAQPQLADDKRGHVYGSALHSIGGIPNLTAEPCRDLESTAAAAVERACRLQR